MALKASHLTAVAAWGAAAYGVVYVGLLPGDYSHDLCGPWG
jgi:hypothetical protein